MKRNLIILIISLISFILYSQDRIYLNDRDFIEVSIFSIRNDTVFSKIYDSYHKNYNKSLNDINGIYIHNKKFTIIDIKNDTVKFNNGSYISLNKFKNLNSQSSNLNSQKLNFKIYSENKIFENNSIEFKYVSYSLERYRRQVNMGRFTMLSGVGLIMIGDLLLIKEQNKIIQQSLNGELPIKNNLPEILMFGGSLTCIIGFITEWNALKYLNNISISIKESEIKYTFKF